MRSKAPVTTTVDRTERTGRKQDAPDAPGTTPSGKRLHAAEPMTVEPAIEAPRRPAPPRFALEVASFIFEERARLERDRLNDAGLPARVTSTTEFGSRVYRVVVGGYANPAAAERAADSLLSSGVVLQARVVTGGN